MALHKTYLFIGTSPDYIVKCDYHKDSCLESKCPHSICDKCPTDSDVSLPFLNTSEDGFLILNPKHQYYTQCKTAGECIRKIKMLFLIYTHHGYFLEGLHFDQDYWLNLKNALFCLSFVLQGFLLKLDIFLLNCCSFLYIFSMF